MESHIEAAAKAIDKALFEITSDICHSPRDIVTFINNTLVNAVGNITWKLSNPNYKDYKKNADLILEGLQAWFEYALKLKFEELNGNKTETK